VEYRDELARMMGEGIAKKEMARRTGLSVPTVRKYLKAPRPAPILLPLLRNVQLGQVCLPLKRFT